jgi:3-hydroxyacyl-[acyl-carrier-protein] dehydratase
MNPETDNITIHKGHFYFDPEDPIYAEHFPGHPVVPGSLIISAFIQAAEGIKQNQKVWNVSNFRFKRFVPPGRYPFQIVAKSGGRLACTLFQDHYEAATGSLCVYTIQTDGH